MSDIYLYSYHSFSDPYPNLPASLYRLKKFGKNQELNRKKIINEHALIYSLKLSGVDLSDNRPDIRISKYGKPYIPEIRLKFNISDSEDKLLIAVSPRDIGVDIERIRNDEYINSVSERFFLRKESEYLKSISDPGLKAAEFTRIWTIKEAYLKCTGTGLSGDLKSISSFALPDTCQFQTALTEDYYYTICEKK